MGDPNERLREIALLAGKYRYVIWIERGGGPVLATNSLLRWLWYEWRLGIASWLRLRPSRVCTITSRRTDDGRI